VTQGEYQLRKLVQRFPEFALYFRDSYRKLRFDAMQKWVPRMGYPKLGETPAIPEVVWPEKPKPLPDQQVYDSDHVFLLLMILGKVEDYFGPYFPMIYGYSPQWHELARELCDHELAENIIGDWTDDGAFDRGTKDRLEYKIFRDYCRGFPRTVAERKLRNFRRLQQHQTEAYAYDKAAFVLGNGILKHYLGVEANIDVKARLYCKPSAQDDEYRARTGSGRHIDTLFAHFLNGTRGMGGARPFLIGMIEAMYALEFGGEVPDGVKAFY